MLHNIVEPDTFVPQRDFRLKPIHRTMARPPFGTLTLLSLVLSPNIHQRARDAHYRPDLEREKHDRGSRIAWGRRDCAEQPHRQYGPNVSDGGSESESRCTADEGGGIVCNPSAERGPDAEYTWHCQEQRAVTDAVVIRYL